jgi:DNA mismatch repair protein MutH
VPRDLRRDKGWIRQLIEWQLGASAGSRPEQDFGSRHRAQDDPVDPQGQTAGNHLRLRGPLIGVSGQRWEESNVRNKLSRVLWIPVEGSRDIPVGERRVGMPLLEPNEEEEGCCARTGKS